MSFEMDRKQYAALYGPTVGDSVRLADTNLFAAVEKDYTVHGQESKFGGGKVLRDGMGVNANEPEKAILLWRIPLFPELSSLTTQALLKRILVFVTVRFLPLVREETQIQWMILILL